MKVAIVGVGSMGGAIMQGLNNLTKYDLIAMNPQNPRVEKLAHEYKFKLVFDPKSLIDLQPDVVILTTPAPVTVAVAEQLQAWIRIRSSFLQQPVLSVPTCKQHWLTIQ